MATSKRCSACKKESGPMHCTGCDEYFCTKDFRIHREGMFTEMDRIVEERNRLQDEINTVAQSNNQKSPLIDEIDKWRDITIEKVKQVAAQVRQQTIELLNSKRTKISTDFKSFSQELAHLKETENYVEHDLTRLNQMISQFKQNLRQSTQPTTIKLHTEESDTIDWNRLIYVEQEQTYTNNQQQRWKISEESLVAAPSPQTQLKCGGRACPKCGKCCDWYIDNNRQWKRRDGATCSDYRLGLGLPLYLGPGPGLLYHPHHLGNICSCK